MDPHSFYLLDPDPHFKKLLDPDPQKMKMVRIHSPDLRCDKWFGLLKNVLNSLMVP